MENMCQHLSVKLPYLCDTKAVDHEYIMILWPYASRLIIPFKILCTSPGQRAFPFCSQYKVPVNQHDTQPGKIFTLQLTRTDPVVDGRVMTLSARL